MKILVTSVGTATGAGLIKAIKKTGRAEVIGADTNLFGYTAGSMLADRYYQLPMADTNSYLQELETIARIEKADKIIPIHDLEIERIAAGDHIYLKDKSLIPPINLIQTVKDKMVCSLQMEKMGIKVPAMVKPHTPVKKILRDRFGVGSKGIWIYEKDEIPIVKEGQFLQEYIKGEEYTVDILSDKNGAILYAVPRIRLEVKSGVATKVKIEHNTELISLAEKIWKMYPIPGCSNIQFMKRGGAYFFIELNYRFSGCGAATLLAMEGGANTLLDILEEKTVVKKPSVAWDSIVTRYYEEVIYPCSV